MHTSSGVDNIDEYLETVVEEAATASSTATAREERPVTARADHRALQDGRPAMAQQEFTVYRTHHGPIVREADGKWIARPADAGAGQGADAVVLAHQGEATYEAFRKTMELHTNSSNNTIFADAEGNIAYFHPQLHPEARRPASTGPSRWTAATRRPTGRALHSLDESAAPAQPGERLALQHQQLAVVGGGRRQPEARRTIPRYMDMAGENPRGLHAMRVLEERKDFTLDPLHRRRVTTATCRRSPS